MTFTAEQIAQAEATADNLAGLLGVDRDTALRFAATVCPFFERGDSIEDAVKSAMDEQRRIAFHVYERRDTLAFKRFAGSLKAGIYPALRAKAEARRAA